MTSPRSRFTLKSLTTFGLVALGSLTSHLLIAQATASINTPGSQRTPIGASVEADVPTVYLSQSQTASVSVLPSKETTLTRDEIRLAYKHYARPGAQPILLIHGLAQNDRGFDAKIPEANFALYLYEQGFDVWIGNCRNAGTLGFRSETPSGPHHWTVEDLALYDIPALILGVREKTGIAPFVVGHSLAAWALEGYLSGLTRTIRGNVRPSEIVRQARRHEVKGVITIAGVYNLWWTHRLKDAHSSPIRTPADYYKSNYEMELLTQSHLLYEIIPRLPALPLGWIGEVLNWPVDQIPLIGPKLRELYSAFQDVAAATPILSMFYYPPNTPPNVVRTHGVDGLEDLGPHLIEQLGNVLNHGQTMSYFHRQKPVDVFEYPSTRSSVAVPMLFIAGGRDRLAAAEMIYRDGFEMTRTHDKQYILNEDAGHLDILVGKNARKNTLEPLVKWILARASQ